MNQIPHCGWPPERARWNNTGVRDCPFCSRNKISPKSKRVHESSLLKKKNFRDSKNIIYDYPVRMQLVNEKTESVNENKDKENENVDEFQEYILQHKPANTEVKTLRNMKAFDAT